MLNISIVLYNHNVNQISPLVTVLKELECVNTIFLIDNSPIINSKFQQLPVKYIFNNKNMGYGAGHNIAMRKTIKENIPYHLVLNPDVIFESFILNNLIGFMERNKDVGHLMPKVFYPNGDVQYLCKLLPTPFDLFVRRFLPSYWTIQSQKRFELRDSGYNKTIEVPYLSGCFMLLRTSVLEEVGLFDERFFMYPEDIDLTRRIHQKYKTIFYPYVSIIHQHTQASYKNKKMLFVHIFNLIKYFNKWGWFFDKKRKKINKETLKMLDLL